MEPEVWSPLNVGAAPPWLTLHTGRFSISGSPASLGAQVPGETFKASLSGHPPDLLNQHPRSEARHQQSCQCSQRSPHTAKCEDSALEGADVLEKGSACANIDS